MLPGVRHWGLLLRLSRNCLKSVEDEEWRAATGHSKGRGGFPLSIIKPELLDAETGSDEISAENSNVRRKQSTNLETEYVLDYKQN